MNRGSTFIFYNVLVVIGIIYCVFALLGSGSDSMFWGLVMMSITIPLFSFVAAGRAKKATRFCTSTTNKTKRDLLRFTVLTFEKQEVIKYDSVYQ